MLERNELTMSGLQQYEVHNHEKNQKMQIVMQILELQTFYLLIILRQETVFILFLP